MKQEEQKLSSDRDGAKLGTESATRDRIASVPLWLSTQWKSIQLAPWWKKSLLVLAVGLMATALALVFVNNTPMHSVTRLEWRILAVLLAMAFMSIILGTWLGKQTWDALLASLGSELVGAVLTYVLLQMIAGGAATKAQLATQMRSDIRGVAVPAVEELRIRGWLEDGSLRGSYFGGANLTEAYLAHADLAGTDFRSADLGGAYLVRANLTEARLQAVNLKRCQLHLANLEGAFLWQADMRGATLFGASLKGADATFAKLDRAVLRAHYFEGPGAGTKEYADLHGTILASASLLDAEVSVEQLQQAKSLAGATLPDGTKLSEDDWEAEFEEWRKKQEEQNE